MLTICLSVLPPCNSGSAGSFLEWFVKVVFLFLLEVQSYYGTLHISQE